MTANLQLVVVRRGRPSGLRPVCVAWSGSGEHDQVQASFAATSGGSAATDADLNWASVPNAETSSHVSFWTASTAGTFLGSDDLDTSRRVAVGGNFTIPRGSVTMAVTPVAALGDSAQARRRVRRRATSLGNDRPSRPD